MNTIIEQIAEDFVNNRWPELRGELRQTAIRGYIDGYKSVPPPYVQLEINFD